MVRKIIGMTLVAALVPVVAAQSTTVPGHEGRAGQVVGKYTATYAYDAHGDSYFDLGDGREQGTVGSISELDSETLTTCRYQVIYRGDFGDDPFLNEGWTINNIRCSGYDDTATYQFRSNWGGDYPQFKNGQNHD